MYAVLGHNNSVQHFQSIESIDNELQRLLKTLLKHKSDKSREICGGLGTKSLEEK